MRKLMQQLLLSFCILRESKYNLPTFQNMAQVVKKKIILLMILNGEGWYYIVVKILPTLLRGMTSKHRGDFYYLNYLHSVTHAILN